ncbi:C-type lectin domain family 2 member B-like isoform X2 [Ambystoma mexicanum]|uniref:C-type lectin domain family 2 member B-like isoform X2 n=1 Tax=Ambystoma mexicanum TaxID=8296 RepID=UPI0037E8203E
MPGTERGDEQDRRLAPEPLASDPLHPESSGPRPGGVRGLHGRQRPAQRSLALAFGAMSPEDAQGPWLPGPPHMNVQMSPGVRPIPEDEEQEGAEDGPPGKPGSRPPHECCSRLLVTVSIPRWVLIAALLVVSTVVSALTAVIGSTAPCPDQWMWYGGKCYQYSKERNTWDASHAFCSSHNASLSIIGTEQEKAVVTRFKDTKDYWVGLRRQAGEWRWSDGSLFRSDIIQIKNTGPGLDCAYVNSEHLSALDCVASRQWLCTKDGTERPSQ